MAAARFLFVTGRVARGGATGSWPATGLAPGSDWYAWRLVGGNNRELGRSARAFATLLEAHRAAYATSEQRLALDPSMTADPITGSWSWRLSGGGETHAVSGRTYSRQRECHYSLAQFLAAAGRAEAAVDVVVVPALRSAGGRASVTVAALR